MAKTWRAKTDVWAQGRARTTFLDLAAVGLEPAAAGNLTAYLHGLGPVRGGWTIEEIEHLLFVRHLVQHRHLSRG